MNRVLLALIAQASTDAGTSLSEDYTRAADAGQAARHEVLQCLLFDQHGGGAGTEFSVRETVHAAIEECRRLLPARIQVSAELYKDADLVIGDSSALRELVTLLFAHAQHALGNRAGRLSFHMDRVEGARAADECPGVEAGTHARLQIRIESGDSTSAAHTSALDALFQAWPSPSRSGQAGEGWNLGLSLARKAAWTLGGRCCGTCAADEAVCTVYLPLAAGLQARSSGARLGPGLGLAVLYVSGEEAILSMGRTSLIESDCCVRIACNGQDALRSLAVRAGEIDLVVTEEHLDDMTGANLVRELQRRHNGLPALIAARPAGAAQPARPEALREYIMTPFSAVDLRSAAWMATAPGRRRPVITA